MLNYYKNNVESNKYFYVDETGKRWNCTGDIWYVDYNGNLYVEGRASDYSIINGEKIYNFDIEKIIKKNKNIKMCDVLSKNDDNNCEKLVAHIILDDNANDIDDFNILRDLQNEIYNETNNLNMVPFIFKIRKDFPYAKSGKRNIQQMKNETEGFIYMDNNLEKEGFCKTLKRK